MQGTTKYVIISEVIRCSFGAAGTRERERERAYRLYSLDNLQRAAGMVPLSELSWRLLFVIHGKDHASRKKLLRGSNSTYNCRRFARSPSSSGIIPVSWLLSNALHGCRRRMVKITPPIDSLSKQAALIVCIQSIIHTVFEACEAARERPEYRPKADSWRFDWYAEHRSVFNVSACECV